MKKCEFNKICRGYKETDYTCNNRTEPIDYCGLWKRHKEDKYSQRYGLLYKLKRIIKAVVAL
jgi:hypothetical protein